MSIETIAVVGGSGTVGSGVLAHLLEHGYRTVNVDREPDGPADVSLEADVLDAGETYGALAKSDADAVVHLGTIPSPVHHPGHVTFESNAMTTFNILAAADELDLEAACMASSINVLGWAYQDAPPELHYLPVDEAHPLAPRDPYALGKHATEVIADGFGRLDGPPSTVATLRFPWVATDEALRERYVVRDRSLDRLREQWVPDGPSGDLFTYVHVADAARAVRRVLEADFEGHEPFWISAPDTSAAVPTERLVETFHLDLETRRDFDGHESLIDTTKAEEMLGWCPERSWRDISAVP